MQEIAPYNIAVTDTQKWVDTVTCWLLECRSYSFKLLTVSLNFTAMFNKTTCLQYNVVLIFICAVTSGMLQFVLGAETVTCRPRYVCGISERW